MDILIKGIDVITADKTAMLVKNADIGIKGGYIEFIDNRGEACKTFKPQRVINGKNRLAMPGLINSHTHCAMTVLRNFADDLALEEWLFKKIFPTEAKLNAYDIYWGTLLGIAEMIKSGTTAFADMYLHMDAVAQATMESGIRANLSRSPVSFTRDGGTIEEGHEVVEYYKRWHNAADGRIKVYVEIHSAYLFNQQSLKDAAQLAKQLNTGIHIHILETARERIESIERYGMDSAKVCLKCGIFDVPVLAAHCVHLDDEDIDIVKQKGVSVVHNPTSNLKLGSGIARIPIMLEKGINVSLGTDGTASNNNLNMFEEMNLTALIHKGVNMDPEIINAEQAIRMATVNGANTIGFGGETGCIKKGMKADLILLNIDQPHFCPMNNPMSAIVYCAQGSDVDTVIIDGKIVMENRELKTIDEEMIKNRVKQIAERILK